MITMKLANEAYRLSMNVVGEAPVRPSRLVSARHDRAAFQILLCADTPYTVSVSGAECYSSRSQRLTGAHERLRLTAEAPFPVTLQIEEFLVDDDEVEKADLLLSCDSRESRAGIPTAVWAEVAVPIEATAGDYPVTVRLFASQNGTDERQIAADELTLSVSKTVLPSPTERSFYLDLWQHCSNIARAHEVPIWSDGHFEILRRYLETLADLGQKSITVCASQIPWRGQTSETDTAHGGNLFEYSMIGVTRRANGRFDYDFSTMQRYIDLCSSLGITGDIEVFGLINLWSNKQLIPDDRTPDYHDPILVRYLDEQDGCMKYMHTAEEIEEYLRAIERYFVETDQISRVRVAADEPADPARFEKALSRLHAIAPRFSFKVAINHAEFIGRFGDRIHDFAPYLKCAIEEYGRLSSFREQDPQKHFLWYVCCGSARPNTFLRQSPLEARMIGPMTAFLGLDGFLRWSYTAWPDPSGREVRYSTFDAGDCNFVYPSRNGGVLLSLRYKNLQRGLDDHALLVMLRETDAAKEALASVMKTTSVSELSYQAPAFTSSWEDFNTFKAKLLGLTEA